MRSSWQNPLEDFFEMRDRLYRLLDESFTSGRAENAPAFTPAVDILAGDEEIVLLVEVPRMSREDVSVEVREGLVTISGERAGNGDGRYFVRERPTGPFSRSFSLAYELDPESVTARLDSGVLQVTVSRRERRTQIAVDESIEE